MGIAPYEKTGGCTRTLGVGDGVLPWSAAEQMPLGYDVPSARRCRAARPLWEGAVGTADWGRENRVESLPPPALRAATSLAEGGKGNPYPLARRDTWVPPYGLRYARPCGFFDRLKCPPLRPPDIRKHTPQKARFAQPRRCAALTDIQYACGSAPRLCTKRALFRCEAVLPK